MEFVFVFVFFVIDAAGSYKKFQKPWDPDIQHGSGISIVPASRLRHLQLRDTGSLKQFASDTVPWQH
jgi:hypothetical protein